MSKSTAHDIAFLTCLRELGFWKESHDITHALEMFSTRVLQAFYYAEKDVKIKERIAAHLVAKELSDD